MGGRRKNLRSRSVWGGGEVSVTEKVAVRIKTRGGRGGEKTEGEVDGVGGVSGGCGAQGETGGGLVRWHAAGGGNLCGHSQECVSVGEIPGKRDGGPGKKPARGLEGEVGRGGGEGLHYIGDFSLDGNGRENPTRWGRGGKKPRSYPIRGEKRVEPG